jgi:hypothetical protein
MSHQTAPLIGPDANRCGGQAVIQLYDYLFIQIEVIKFQRKKSLNH